MVAYCRRRISGGRKNSKFNYCYTFCPGRRVGMNKPPRRDGTFLLRPAILAFTKTRRYTIDSHTRYTVFLPKVIGE